MLNKFLLHEKREEDFDTWIGRWLEKQNFEYQLYIANCKGYTRLKFDLCTTEGFDVQRYKEFRGYFRNTLKYHLPYCDIKYDSSGYIVTISWEV